MTEYLTEQEQIELLKNWLKQYSVVILSGVALAIILISGWRFWQQRQVNILTHASAVYDEMISMRAQNNTHATVVQATKLFTHYPKTSYGPLAALMLARDAVAKNDYPGAEDKLKWVMDNSKVTAFREIARIRLARVLIAEQKSQDALNVLTTVDDQAFNGLIDEVRGDAYVALKNNASARDVYKKALSELPGADTNRPLLQIKYDNLST